MATPTRERRLIGNVWQYVTVEENGGGGSSGISSPLDIDDCALWLDASTLALADDDPVDLWPDGSVSGYDATANLSNQTYGIADFPASAGTFTVIVDDGENPTIETGPINFNDDAAAVAAVFATALVTVTATGGALPDVDVAVEFTGAYGGKPITLTIGDDSLTDGTASTTPGTAGGVSSAPVCKTAILNGLRVVRFDGNGTIQYLKLTGAGLDLFRNLDAFTLAAVWAAIPGADDYVFQASSGTDLANRRVKLEPNANDSSIQLGATNDDGDDASVASLDLAGSGTDPKAVAWVGAVDFVGRGVTAAAGEATGTGASGPGFGGTAGPMEDTASLAIHIGATPDGTQGFLVGDVAEIIVYQRALNALERRQLLEYLSVKWSTL